MLGAPAGGFLACGHQGFDSLTVLPMVPPKGVALPALMRSSLPLLLAAAVAPRLTRPALCPGPGLPQIIIRIMIMNNRRCKRHMQGIAEELDLPGVAPSRQKRS